MKYNRRYQELVELSHSDDSEIRHKADNWLIAIGLQDVDDLKVSDFLIDLAVRNVKGELTSDEVTQLLDEYHSKKHHSRIGHSDEYKGLDGDYEVVPPDSPRIKQIEEYNRKLRPELYALIDKKKNRIISE